MKFEQVRKNIIEYIETNHGLAHSKDIAKHYDLDEQLVCDVIAVLNQKGEIVANEVLDIQRFGYSVYLQPSTRLKARFMLQEAKVLNYEKWTFWIGVVLATVLSLISTIVAITAILMTLYKK